VLCCSFIDRLQTNNETNKQTNSEREDWSKENEILDVCLETRLANG
jgi:hypothetical protein